MKSSASGSSRRLAMEIAEQTGAALFEIAPEAPYPQSYDECLEEVQALPPPM